MCFAKSYAERFFSFETCFVDCQYLFWSYTFLTKIDICHWDRSIYKSARNRRYKIVLSFEVLSSGVTRSENKGGGGGFEDILANL